jgi:hypothetical protein
MAALVHVRRKPLSINVLDVENIMTKLPMWLLYKHIEYASKCRAPCYKIRK